MSSAKINLPMNTPTSPTSGYFRDLLDQPKAVDATLDGLREQLVDPFEAIRGRLAREDYRRVLLTGMGSSYHAFHPLQQALVRRGIAAQMVETSELLYSLPDLLQADTLVIAASQSGRSAEIVSLVERKAEMKDRGFSLLGVSNTPGSPLANASDACVLTRAGEEVTVSCKTYLATLMALAWLEPALLGESTGPVLAELSAASGAVAAYLSGLQEHVSNLKKQLTGIRDLFLVGRGISLAAVGTGGLILKEATHRAAEGMSSAAFRHGPLDMVTQNTFVLVFQGLGPGAALNRKLYDEIRAAGGQAGWVSPEVKPSHDTNASSAVFHLPPVSERLLPLVEILPVQMMTLALAEIEGHEPGQFTRSTKVTTSE